MFGVIWVAFWAAVLMAAVSAINAPPVKPALPPPAAASYAPAPGPIWLQDGLDWVTGQEFDRLRGGHAI